MAAATEASTKTLQGIAKTTDQYPQDNYPNGNMYQVNFVDTVGNVNRKSFESPTNVRLNRRGGSGAVCVMMDDGNNAFQVQQQRCQPEQ